MSSILDKDTNRPKKPHVLVVDDEPNIRRAISRIIHSEFKVTLAENGNKAIERIMEGHEFDVVSLDLQMPGMTGIETLKVVKQLSPTTEVLIVSAHSDVDSAKAALKFGAYDYIDKPFNNNALREAIRKGIARRGHVIGAQKAKEQLAFVKAQLIQSEKFSIIGQLIASVAHDINNPLSAIMGFSQIPLMTECSPEEIKEYMIKINKSAILCKKIVEKLLAFSRKKDPERQLVQINSIIESSLELIQHDFKKENIMIIKNLAGNLPDIMADFYELQQVFMNIINNAHHAMKSDIVERIFSIKSEFEGKMIRISFQDTGQGIPEKKLHQIFEPLFTTKEKGEGTGLGLSICYDIIKNYNGDIYVASKEGNGACFVIELPIVASETCPSPNACEEN